jgi:hypothetical protein
MFAASVGSVGRAIPRTQPMEAVAQRLREIHPLLTRLTVLDAAASHCDALPPYLAMIWSVMAKPPGPPVCFVFPRRGELARLAALTYCLNHLAELHRQAVLRTSLDQFKKGDHVLVHPSREVFVYLGPDESMPGKFCLGPVGGKPSITLGLPLSALRRLEKTTRKRPKGDIGLARQLQHPPQASLDQLLGTDTYGNLSAVQNEVLLLDSMSGFQEFAAALHLQPVQPVPGLPSAKQMLPFGTLDQEGPHKPTELHKWDASSAAGQPLLAVTSSAGTMANHCLEMPAKTKLVLVNGLNRLRDLQAFDDVAGSQHLVLFADHDDDEDIRTLAGRGCRFWYLQGAELLWGANGASPASLFGSIARWTRNHEHLAIDDEPCEDARIDGIFSQLDRLRDGLSGTDGGQLDRMAAWAWRTFSRLRAALSPPSNEERNRVLVEIEVFRRDIKSYGVWFKPDVAAGLEALADALAAAYDGSLPVGPAKGAVLKAVVIDALKGGQKIALLAKTENQVTEIRKWTYERAFPADLGVYSLRTLPDDQVYDRLICISWPGGDSMRQIAARLAAPRITIVGYPCERRWLKQSRHRLNPRPSVGGFSDEDKAAFISSDGRKVTWPSTKQAVPVEHPTSAPDIWDFEQRLRGARIGLAARPTEAVETVPARYVRFTGEHYAFLTDTHRVPVATELLSGRIRPNQKLPERVLKDIKPGDFVVFPASGARVLVHMLADKLLARNAAELRRRARRWQEALHSSKLTPHGFHVTAMALDMNRHPGTIQHWFDDENQIGPRHKEDLVLIGLATEDRAFEAVIDDTWDAIETVRGAHLSAGMKLRDALLQRLPSVMGRVEESGTEIDLGELGSAWVVQVDAITDESEPRGRGEINRLLAEHAMLPAIFHI